MHYLSNEELERYWFQYKTEAKIHGTQLEKFCRDNKISYKALDNWRRQTKNRIYPVPIVETESKGSPTCGLADKALLLVRLQTLDEGTCDAIIKAIRYLDNHWDNAMRYRVDGRYPMDNNAAERAFRSWAMKMKTTLQFGSDEGAEMAAAYHSIVETVKMCGRSVWHFFGDFFRKVVDKNTDIRLCLPPNLGLSLAGS